KSAGSGSAPPVPPVPPPLLDEDEPDEVVLCVSPPPPQAAWIARKPRSGAKAKGRLLTQAAYANAARSVDPALLAGLRFLELGFVHLPARLARGDGLARQRVGALVEEHAGVPGHVREPRGMTPREHLAQLGDEVLVGLGLPALLQHADGVLAV